MDAFVLHFDGVLHDEKASTNAFATPLNLLHGLVDQGTSDALQSFAASLFPYIFLFASVLPRVLPVDATQESIAKDLWGQWEANGSLDAKRSTLGVIKHILRELLIDPLSRPTCVLR